MRFINSLLIAALFACPIGLYAQSDTLSLKECINLGIANNLSLQNSRLGIRTAKIGQTENRAKLLPVIQGFGNFVNNVERATQLTDGTNLSKLLGVDAPYMMGKGLRYNTSGGFQLSMPLYDQTIYTGIDIANRMVEISQCSYEKAREDLMVEIAKLYYLLQTTDEQIRLTRNNITRLEELREITQAFYDNDIVLEVDVKRVSVNLSNLQVKLDNAESMKTQQLNMMRYILDLSPETPLAVARLETEETLLSNYTPGGLSHSLYELQLLDKQSDLLVRQKKLVNQGYIPTLSLVGNFSYAAYTDHLKNYFHSHPTNKWYNSTYWGLSLKIPVFDAFAKRNKVRKIETEQMTLQNTIENTNNQLQTQYSNAMEDWENNLRNVRNQSENYRLAEDIYTVTADQYREGVSSMTDLLQDEMQMTNTETTYVTAVYNLLASRLTLMKLSGQLNLLTEQPQNSNGTTR